MWPLEFNDLPNNLDIYLVGDLHAGESNFLRERFERFWMENIVGKRNTRVIGMGDWLSSILPKDRRHDVRAYDRELNTFKKAKNYVRDFLKKHCKYFLYFKAGNHEETLSTELDDIVEDICDDAGVQYGGYMTFATLNFKNGKSLEFFTWHGRGQINSVVDDEDDRRASKRRSLRRKMIRKADADLYAMGHTHDLDSFQRRKRLVLVKDKPGHITHEYRHQGRRAQWFVNTGAFLKSYVEFETTYAERAGYDPLPLGCSKVIIRNGEIVNVEEVYI
jgi:predicted phosphodiesterase